MQQSEIVVDAVMAVHIIAGFGALFTGLALIFLLPRSGQTLRVARLWQLTMLVMLITSFDIQVMQPGSYSAIHGLSLLVILLLGLESWSMWQGREKIQGISRATSYGILWVVLGAIVMSPGGVINQWFFA